MPRHPQPRQRAGPEPTWFVGFSDIATLITPITVCTGLATLHGNNLMDTPYDVPKPLLSWLDIAALPTGSTFTQASPGVHGHNNWDWTEHPRATEYPLTGTGGWHRLDGDGPVDVTGRLIGGCIETLRNLAGFFDAANAVLVGRTRAPDAPTLSQYDAALDALGGLGVPLVADVECGHVPPYLPPVNGALGRLRLDGRTGSLTQTLD